MSTKLSDFSKQDQIILKRWFTIRSLSDSTQEPYLSYFSGFLDFCNLSVERIYNKAKEEEREGIPEKDRELTWLIVDYKNYIEDKQYAQNTINLKLNIIFSFCRSFDFPIPKFRMKKALCEEKNYERPLTKEEILQMMNVSPLRERAFIMIQCGSGMGSKEVRSLTIKQIIDVINKELGTNCESVDDVLSKKPEILSHNIYEITIIRSKTNYRYTTFMNNETMKHILEYIEWRSKQDNKKRLTYAKNEPLFVTNEGKPMSQKTVTAMYREIGNRCGFESEEYTYRYWRSHNIRKFFYNIVEAVVGEEFAHEWLGHKSDNVTRAYSRKVFRMRSAYEKCIPYLRIESESDDELKKRVEQLEMEIRKLKEL